MQTVSRLITQFIPEHYQLSLTLNRKERTFSGTVVINGQSSEDLTSISVHAKDLDIQTVTLDGKAATFTQAEHDELVIKHSDITSGRHIIVIAFNGKITDAMHGLYPCYYDHNGAKKELLATQFESHHAREVFPCIDEPEAKATFDVTLTTEKDITVLGNMPIASQKTDGDQLVTTFDTTPRMSTYLLAWVTGELHKKTAVTKSGVEVNIWATPAQNSERLDFALDIARRTIDFFDSYFGVPYPLPKSDHVALPDFSSGAMENWGLITYREVALLADPETTSISSKHYIATVIAHELSHQWFGNLVTMKWWNNLWLNESFATLMEYIAVDALHPEWNIWMDFATSESIMALRRDSIDGVQAVQVDVNHPDEISTLFDGAIVYAKGARLLRMLQHYIGHEAFQKGLQQYFNTHKYQNTEGNDLWSALSNSSGKDIATFMNVWISQPGYPKVTVSQLNSSITLQQSQFFVGPHTVSNKLWPIPLNSSLAEMPELLEEAQLTYTPKDDTPPLLNVGSTAHFITQYDHSILAKHLETVSDGTLPPIDRLQLLNEQTLLARAGDISSADLIPLLNAYKDESIESVWDIISLSAAELRKFVEDDAAAESKLRDLSGDLARTQYQRLGWYAKPNEPETDTKLRSTIIGMMLYSEDADTIQTAVSMYETLPLEKLDPELRSLAIMAAVRYSDDPGLIDSLIDQYKRSNSGELQQDIAAGITASRDPRVLARALDLIKDESVVRHQDVFRWFVWTIRNRYGRDLAWEWLQNNWEWIEQTFGGDKSYDDFPRYSASGLVNHRQLEEYRNFFIPKKKIPALSRVITMGISEIEGRVDLIERDQADVCKALREL
ncbi:MAG TPA: M1 family metallopeptidase [Candidatus Saccharimonadales bacterium]|nr:M1 family metallopeptidase [Candidatus Saccharimonadales bacterium]